MFHLPILAVLLALIIIYACKLGLNQGYIHHVLWYSLRGWCYFSRKPMALMYSACTSHHKICLPMKLISFHFHPELKIKLYHFGPSCGSWPVFSCWDWTNSNVVHQSPDTLETSAQNRRKHMKNDISGSKILHTHCISDI